ncbi:PREDICTED: uncharacterized protein LOC107352255 [Acropora digitifera]|uniref:uncharacterized protein LOC107352255 n=1 Tax=Acropora digitifera TaxID=70779 RepID=UPI00077A3514|nr:PREDICTED: uncharacterized protein LOC107352255 [Acropora digitifera]
MHIEHCGKLACHVEFEKTGSLHRRLDLHSYNREESHSRKSTVGASAIRFVKEKRTKEKLVSASQGSSGEESGVEVEETTSQPKKRASSWRFAAMFTKTQINTKPDKGRLLFMILK